MHFRVHPPHEWCGTGKIHLRDPGEKLGWMLANTVIHSLPTLNTIAYPQRKHRLNTFIDIECFNSVVFCYVGDVGESIGEVSSNRRKCEALSWGRRARDNFSLLSKGNGDARYCMFRILLIRVHSQASYRSRVPPVSLIERVLLMEGHSEFFHEIDTAGVDTFA